MQNPSSNVASILYDNYNGRPPEDTARINGLPVLEWPDSPSILEEQSCPKKGRCEDAQVIYNNTLGASDMDVDGVDDSSEKAVSVDDGSAAQQDLQPDGKGVPITTGKKSYASMVVRSQDRRSGKEHIGCFDVDNIIVLEEDVSKSNNAITEVVGGSRFASLVGELTIVEDHNNILTHVEKHRVEPEVVDIDVSDCNEDEVLHPMNPDPMKHMVHNAAYMTSNPDKKVKSSKPTAKGINVVSMNNGQAAVVKERMDNKLSGNHQAVVIEELGGRKPHALALDR
ncbi:hypothetical protein V6N13_020502 [Hibiscus sabdariffa]|uniref:Uncharacterized protein n=1 Tax=Hibiscus sabdariffa TaxID=183260 RepID=A0ABR2ETM5_9ROSI